MCEQKEKLIARGTPEVSPELGHPKHTKRSPGGVNIYGVPLKPASASSVQGWGLISFPLGTGPEMRRRIPRCVPWPERKVFERIDVSEFRV